MAFPYSPCQLSLLGDDLPPLWPGATSIEGCGVLHRPDVSRYVPAGQIQRWCPCEKSTGPKTPEGKRRSAIRGYKGGHWKLARELLRALREQKKAIHDIATV